MQESQDSTGAQNQAPSAEFVLIPRQSDDDWAVKSMSLGSDRSNAADAQAHRYGEDWERDHDPEVPLTMRCHMDITKIRLV
jgi:hypothetical protein